MITTNDTQAAITAGAATTVAMHRIAAISHPLDREILVNVAVAADGSIVTLPDVNAKLDELYADRPRKGVTRLSDLESFCAFLKRWGGDDTVVYADTAALSLIAVLDDHPPDPVTAGDRQHRAVYACPRDPAWIAWTAIDGKPMPQLDFANFLESHLEDLISSDGMPRPNEMLSIARNLAVVTKGEYRRDYDPTTGNSVLVCKTETDTAKSTSIPRAFAIAIPVFEGGIRYSVEARVRFALVEGRAMFTVILHRRAEIERDAFAEVRVKVHADTNHLVLAGTP